MSTPHISAEPGEIAKNILLPGDPLRAKVIAEKFLENPKLVSSVRNNYCYTGLYKGNPVSIMSTGMGCGSMGIYSYELFNFYNVENAIRIGTMGALNKEYKIGDVVIASSTITNTNYKNFFAMNGEAEINASSKLLTKAIQTAKESNIQAKQAKLYTTDTFYGGNETSAHQADLGVAGVEMECAALYINANEQNKNALTICTVSDEVYSGKKTTSDERQNLFLSMAQLALDLTTKLC